MLNALYIEDKETYLIDLPSGDYQINGEFVKLNGYKATQMELDRIDDIRPVTSYIFTDRYESASGDVLTCDEHSNMLYDLKSKGYYDEDESYYVFDNIEDEVKYIRFCRKWTPIDISKTIVGDPIPVAVKKTQMSTGNEFVIPCWQLGGKFDDPVCVYSRMSAMIDVVKKTFAELGLKHDGDCDYKSTKDKKVYGYKNDTNLRYWKAFGTYIFSEKHWALRGSQTITGDMKTLLTRYETERKRMREELIAQYNSQFGSFSENEAVRILHLFREDVKNIVTRISSLSVMSKSRSPHHTLQQDALELQRKLDAVLCGEFTSIEQEKEC